jgi:hypothetical protein
MALPLPLLSFQRIATVRMEGTKMLQPVERQRCQAKRSIRGHQGSVSAECRGTIEAEIDNLGRHLIAVRWDNGIYMYVFPDEIDIDDSLAENEKRAS